MFSVVLYGNTLSRQCPYYLNHTQFPVGRKHGTYNYKLEIHQISANQCHGNSCRLISSELLGQRPSAALDIHNLIYTCLEKLGQFRSFQNLKQLSNLEVK